MSIMFSIILVYLFVSRVFQGSKIARCSRRQWYRLENYLASYCSYNMVVIKAWGLRLV